MAPSISIICIYPPSYELDKSCAHTSSLVPGQKSLIQPTPTGNSWSPPCTGYPLIYSTKCVELLLHVRHGVRTCNEPLIYQGV